MLIVAFMLASMTDLMSSMGKFGPTHARALIPASPVSRHRRQYAEASRGHDRHHVAFVCAGEITQHSAAVLLHGTMTSTIIAPTTIPPASTIAAVFS